MFLCVGFICCELSAISNNVKNAKTNADRVVFINKLGYTLLDETPNTKTIIIPERFYEVYTEYNRLQNKSGYDLSSYKGCEAVLYTYRIKAPTGYDGECVINIIIYNDRVIGGDISSTAFDGFMLPLKDNNEKTKT